MERESDATTSVDMAALLADSAGDAAVLARRYRLGDVLGEGGMAVVHRAEDTLLQRPVAVKVLRDDVAGTADRARFTAEVRTLGALSHPGLVTVLDAGVAEQRPYLVMELVDGGTLAGISTPVALERAAEMGAQVASALAYAHARGVIHRDVKPANVLLCRDGRVKLADFGIARIVGDTVHHTRTGALIGTVSYLSPEQVEGAELTTALDVYSLGLVLLELITGRRPFPGPSVESALSRLSRPPEMPLDLPPVWWALLAAMTARDPADRPTALEVSQRLGALRGGSVAAAHADAPRGPVAPVAPTPPPARSPRRAWGVLVAAAAVLLVVTAAAAGGKGAGPDTALDARQSAVGGKPALAAAADGAKTEQVPANAAATPGKTRADRSRTQVRQAKAAAARVEPAKRTHAKAAKRDSKGKAARGDKDKGDKDKGGKDKGGGKRR